MTETVISIPAGEDGHPRAAPVPAVRSHQAAAAAQRHDEESGSYVNNSMSNISSTSVKPVDMIVYFADKVGLHMKIEDGQNISAGELFELVLEEMNLVPDQPSHTRGRDNTDDPFSAASVLDLAREVFSLWLVSDLLELQLKPTHVPFKLIVFWEELLEKYTSASEVARQRDEPVIMFKRNVYFHRNDEKKITHERILQLLYHEARVNMINGRYPLNQEECDERATLQAVITQREMKATQNPPESVDDETFGTTAYFKTRLTQYLPAHLSKRHWIFKTSTNPECRLAAGYGRRVVAGEARKNMSALYTAYLDLCRCLPYYGAAYLRGQAEHPGRKGIFSSAPVDDPVYVAVNVDGVFIIDMDDVVLLLGLYYEEMSWKLYESKESANKDCLPCLFLQFQEKKNANVTKLLQIFSKEAVLMDNLIDSCVQLKTATKRQRLLAGETRDEIPRNEIVKNFERLALLTIDSKGCIVDSTVRTPKSASK